MMALTSTSGEDVSGSRTISAPVAPSALGTMDDQGRRKWLRPRPSPGRFRLRRGWVAFALIALFTLLPHVQMHGKQAFLLDIAARRFTIFGYTFLPTDTILLALLGVGTLVTIFLLTAVVGRAWCGWACPQTVYLEFVYRPLERFFEGGPGKPAKNWLQRSGAGKILKYVAYLAVSLFLAHTFLAYFVGVERLMQWVRLSPFEHPVPFLVMAVVTGLMMFDFAFFREQTCIVACPYGRFQSVMLDKSSLIVGYDARRGEPRGKKKAADVSLPVLGAASAAQGDCIDCKMCVTTCPTGIDIRNGLQLECIHCAQCIDACDTVMDKIGKPRGLIRYSSQSGLEGEKFRFLRPRLAIYPAVLLVVFSLFTYLLLHRGPAYVHVQRGFGAPFSTLPSGEVANPVRIKIINRRDHAMEYTVVPTDDATRVIAEPGTVLVEPYQAATMLVTIASLPDSFARGQRIAGLSVRDSEGFAKDVTYRMMGPARGTRPLAPTDGGTP